MHHGLRKYQTEAIEAIQRRAVRIIYSVSTSMPYWVALQYAELPPVSDRRDKLCREFFVRKLLNKSNCCHPLVTLKSRLGSDEQPRFLDPVTVLTATNLLSVTPS